MYTCAKCAVRACTNPDVEKLPKNCPIHQKELMDKAVQAYSKTENHAFFVESSAIEALGYGHWTRLRETMELCRRLGYHRVGMAFCNGLRREAAVIDTILRDNGFEVVSVICKAGGIPKESLGIAREHKLDPDRFDPSCNPIAQAELLNQQDTDFNIAVGLCVGHDSLFFKYSKAMATALIAKDRVLAHNPVGAVYCAEGYYKGKLKL